MEKFFMIAFLSTLIAFAIVLVLAITLASKLKEQTIETAKLKGTLRLIAEKERAKRLKDERWERDVLCGAGDR